VSSQPTIVAEEPPEIAERIRRVGSILAAAGTAFFFISFLFAFLYLRALNTNGLWGGGKPHHHVHASLGLGIGILVSVLASVALAAVGERRPTVSVRAGFGALTLAVVAIALQCVQWAVIGFGPGDGGYASVYFGWTGFFTIFVLGAVYWLETTLAGAVRTRAPGAETAGLLGSFVIFWATMGLVEIAAFILLFLVK
jgi:heme/copper-type cytochrome/quinol oxidase subunit 3